MRAKVKRSFRDLKEKRRREEGEVFELSEERFREINRKLNGYIVETDEPAEEPEADAEPEAKPKRRTASTRAKKPENK